MYRSMTPITATAARCLVSPSVPTADHYDCRHPFTYSYLILAEPSRAHKVRCHDCAAPADPFVAVDQDLAVKAALL